MFNLTKLAVCAHYYNLVSIINNQDLIAFKKCVDLANSLMDKMYGSLETSERPNF
jgi:hypothetical protein